MRPQRILLASSATLLGLASLARASNPQPQPPVRFGMVGLARTQTAILNVVLVTHPPDDGRSACRMVLSFVDGQGRPFHDAAGNEVRKSVDLRGGGADSLGLRAGDILGAAHLRIPVRAVIIPVSDDGVPTPDDGIPTPDDGNPTPDDGMPSTCKRVVASLEIVGPVGATQLLYAPTPDDGQPVPNDGQPTPHDGEPTPDDGLIGARFGMVGLARTQTAVLNAVLAFPTPDDGRAACRMVLSFVDAQGRPFHDAAGSAVSEIIELRGGAAHSMRLRSGDVLRNDQLRIPIRAVLTPTPDDGLASHCSGLVATLEIVSALGVTEVLYSPTPDDSSPTPDDGLPPADDGIGR
jgi:hypothetical protein